MAFVIPGGKEKNTPIEKASDESLSYWSKRIGSELAEDPNKKFADRDRSLVSAMQDELARRGSGASQAPAPRAATTSQATRPNPQAPQGAMVRQPEGPPAASSGFAADNPASVTAWFTANRDQYHIVTPATVVPNLPPGCEVAINVVHVDPTKDAGDVYPLKGSDKLGLTAFTLSRISQAAGITWDIEHCGRVDDRSDPRYVEYRAVGRWRLFDGTEIEECASRAVDLRDGSDEAEGMTEKQVAQQRLFVLPLAESKAKNRVIRRLGVKSGYTADELKKPFAVARLMFTGRTDDPELRQAFALLKAQQMLGGTKALFGAGPILSVRPVDASAARAPQFQAAPQPYAPALPSPSSYPMLGTSGQEPYLDASPESPRAQTPVEPSGGAVQTKQAPATGSATQAEPPTPVPPRPTAPAPQPSEVAAQRPPTARSETTIPFGVFRHRTVESLDESDLASLMEDCRVRIEDPEVLDIASEKAILRAAGTAMKAKHTEASRATAGY